MTQIVAYAGYVIRKAYSNLDLCMLLTLNTLNQCIHWEQTGPLLLRNFKSTVTVFFI